MDPDYHSLTMKTQNEVLMDTAVSYEAVLDEVREILDSVGRHNVGEHCIDHHLFDSGCQKCHNEVYSSAFHKINVVMNGVQKYWNRTTQFVSDWNFYEI